MDAEARLRREGDCLVWTGSRKWDGYGRLIHKRKHWLAHRFIWTLRKGPIPPGMCVLHRCDNPPCCNVDHLFLGTVDDNNKDASRKGRLNQPHPIKGEASNFARLNTNQVLEIRGLVASGLSNREVADRYGVAHQTVSKIARRETWPHV